MTPKMLRNRSNFDDVFEPLDSSKNVTPWLSGRLGGAAPLEIRPLSLVKAQEGAVERSDLKTTVVANANPQRLPQVNSPKSPPTGLALLPGGVALGGHFDS